MKRLNSTMICLAAGLLAGAAFAPDAQAAQSASQGAKTDLPLSRLLATPAGSGVTAVIVRTTGPLTVAQEAQMTGLGADITRHLPLIQSLALHLPTRNLSKLAALPFVARLSYDGEVKKCDLFTVGSSGAGTAYTSYGLTGQGVTVAVVDSGVTPLTDVAASTNLVSNLLGSRILASVNFSSAINSGALTLGVGTSGVTVSSGTTALKLGINGISSSNNGNTYDPCGHGTHVAGIISGNGAASSGTQCFQTYFGIARNANLVSVRVLDGTGASAVSTVISGLQWVVTNKSKYNIRVINLSLGHAVGESYKTDPLCQAVEAAWKAGIVVVCAAGNEGRLNAANDPTQTNEGWGTAYGSIASPGNDPYVITVGATKSMDGNRAHDRIATYSSRGPSRLDLILKPDIIAPGNKIISLDAGGSSLDTYGGGANRIPVSTYRYSDSTKTSSSYFCLSGTSMAAPVVAGAAALLLQANPKLTPDTVKARLMLTADKWTDPSGNADPCTYGAGYLNIPAALTSSVVAAQPTLSPNLYEDSIGNVYINLSQATWGKSLWGTGLTDLHAIWGKTAISGSATLTASHAIWGKSIWSDNSQWTASTSAVDLNTAALNGE